MKIPEPRTDRIAVMRAQAIARLMEVVGRERLADPDRPHVVLTHDPRTGAWYVTGPFRDAVAALAAADRQRRRDRAGGVGGILRSHAVLPLLEGSPTSGGAGEAGGSA